MTPSVSTSFTLWRSVHGLRVIVVLSSLGLGSSACAGAIDYRDADLERTSAASSWLSADVASLAPAEKRALVAGELVTVPMVQRDDERRYTGGVAHLLIEAPAHVVVGLLDDTRGIQRVLPKTKRATLIDEGQGWRQVELLQGNNWVEATYTVTLVEEPAVRKGQQRVQFALNPARRHDVDDVRGYFAIEPLTPEHCVVSVAAFVDLGSSLAVLFERRIQDLILATPLEIRDYVASSRVASRR